MDADFPPRAILALFSKEEWAKLPEDTFKNLTENTSCKKKRPLRPNDGDIDSTLFFAQFLVSPTDKVPIDSLGDSAKKHPPMLIPAKELHWGMGYFKEDLSAGRRCVDRVPTEKLS